MYECNYYYYHYYYGIHNALEWQNILDIFCKVPHKALSMVFMYLASKRITFHTAYQKCQPIILYCTAARTHQTKSVSNRSCVS